MRSIWRLICAFAFLCVIGAGAPAQANSKYAAFVMHADSGDVLFDRYSTARRYPASLTKMMTLYLLFDAVERGELTLQSKLTVSRRAAGQPPSKLGLKAGSTITVENAINALVIKSANDVAVVVAESLDGSEWRFAKTMTQKARSLGMRSTTFRNASGLPNSKQITTARDMAVLGQRVMQDFPQYFHYFKATSFTYNGRTYATHNKLVRNFKGADGIKTGYTRRSGFNLVTSAEQNGQRLVGVVLGGRKSYTRDRHMRDIMNNAFAAIRKNPKRIAALHRKTPSPRLKPSLLDANERRAPTIAGSEPLRQEIQIAAADFAGDDGSGRDLLGALIASSEQTADEHAPAGDASGVVSLDGYVGEGDRERLKEYAFDVQIGAYSSFRLAESELANAARAAGLTNMTSAIIPMVRIDGSKMYRARFRRLSEIEAAVTCEGLKDAGVSCFVTSEDDIR